MKKTTTTALVAAASLAVTLGLAAPAQAAPAQAAPRPSDHLLPAAASVSEQARDQLDGLIDRLPADWQTRRDVLMEDSGLSDTPSHEALAAKVAEAIDPDDYVCAPTAFNAFIDEAVAGIDPDTLAVLAPLGVLDFPTLEALLLGTEGDPDFALGQDAAVLTSSFELSRRFWDVKLDDVELMAMHGQMVTDVDRVAAVLELAYGLGGAEAVDVARDIVDVVKSDPGLQRGRNPLFTLNAFAFSGDEQTDPLLRSLPDKVISGDGLLTGMKAVGLKRIGAQAVMAHEVAHHVQWEADLYDSDLPAPEATRRTELMADAFASYLATHKKGLGLTATQMLLVQDSFFNLGDCEFDNPAHHGTPNQRRAATSWGIATAATVDSAVRVIPAARLGARFDKVLPQLVAPDAATAPAAWMAAARAAA